MTPQEHYDRAEELLNMAESALDNEGATHDGVQAVMSIAAVHAQLAQVSPTNPGEA